MQDPSQLQTVLPGAKPTDIDHVEVSIDSSTPITATLDVLGNWSTVVTICTNNSSKVEATVVAKDGTRVTADITLCGPTALAPNEEPANPIQLDKSIFLPVIRNK